MKKNIILVVALLALMAVGVFAQTEADFVVAVSKDGKSVAITEYKGKATAVNIPARIKNLPVTVIDGSSFMDANVTSVIIPNGVISIGESAFNGCTSLNNITIPNTVTTIGNASFYRCSDLSSVTIPSSVTSIGSNAFQYCMFTSVTFAGSIPASGFNNNAFRGLGDLRDKFYAKDKDKGTPGTYTRPEAHETTWTLSTATTAAGTDIFTEGAYQARLIDGGKAVEIVKYNFKDLALIVPQTIRNLPVTVFGKEAFMGSVAGTITIRDGITTIGEGAFKNCENLNNLTIPKTVTSIGVSAFQGCLKLWTITFAGTIPASGFNANIGLGDIRTKFYATDKDKGTPGTYFSADGGRSWTKK